MKAVKAYFLNLLLREKMLCVAFVLIIAGWWFSSFAGRAALFARTFRQTTETLTAQDGWLARRNEIETASKRAISQLDPARTYDSTRLQSEISTLSAGLPDPDIEPRPDQRADQFTVHSVQFSVHRAEFVSLERFYLEVSKLSPYINIEDCSINVDLADPSKLNASMQISSVEIVK